MLDKTGKSHVCFAIYSQLSGTCIITASTNEAIK